MPDDQLTQLAAKGSKLRDPAELEKQVRRMIADKRSWNFVEHFTTQWLDLSGSGSRGRQSGILPRFQGRVET